MQFCMGEISFYCLTNERANQSNFECLEINSKLFYDKSITISVFHTVGTISTGFVPDATAVSTKTVDLYESDVNVSEKEKREVEQ